MSVSYGIEEAMDALFDGIDEEERAIMHEFVRVRIRPFLVLRGTDIMTIDLELQPRLYASRKEIWHKIGICFGGRLPLEWTKWPDIHPRVFREVLDASIAKTYEHDVAAIGMIWHENCVFVEDDLMLISEYEKLLAEQMEEAARWIAYGRNPHIGNPNLKLGRRLQREACRFHKRSTKASPPDIREIHDLYRKFEEEQRLAKRK